MKKLFLLLACIATSSVWAAPLVLQSDFGVKDGAVAEMKGIAVGVSPTIVLHDLSHHNTPFNIWEAAYRLKQTAPYWPEGTVFVSVIDPGVGTERKSVVLKTRSGHFFVTPDNGTLTLVAEELGIEAVREIDETKHRRSGSNRSYTFHGRDVYAYMGAKLAAGVTTFDDVGPLLPPQVVALPYEKPRRDGAGIVGTIPYLDFQYGNVWTNLDDALFEQLGVQPGEKLRVVIRHADEMVYEGVVPYARTFGEVPEGEPLLYLNSLMNVALALNMGDFARTHQISYGAEWSIRVEPVR